MEMRIKYRTVLKAWRTYNVELSHKSARIIVSYEAVFKFWHLLPTVIYYMSLGSSTREKGSGVTLVSRTRKKYSGIALVSKNGDQCGNQFYYSTDSIIFYERSRYRSCINLYQLFYRVSSDLKL